jgi:hypothetical protein
MSDRTTATRGARTNVQKAAAIVGVVFLLVGVLGFIPGITTNFDPAQYRAPVVRDRRLGSGPHRIAGPHLPGVWWRDLPGAVRVWAYCRPGIGGQLRARQHCRRHPASHPRDRNDRARCRAHAGSSGGSRRHKLTRLLGVTTSVTKRSLHPQHRSMADWVRPGPPSAR